MGQYWKLVNLDKREYVHPHRIGAGLKIREQLWAHPGTGAALVVLCAAMPVRRGGGDFNSDGAKDADYPALAQRTIGRWAGCRIAFVGDYAEAGDLPGSEIPADQIYGLCVDDGEDPETTEYPRFTDVTADVARVLEHEMGGKFSGDGWRRWVEDGR